MKYSFTSNTMRLPSTFLLLVSFLHLIFLSTCSNAKSQVRCIEKEKQALLDFKLSFVSPSLPTWTNSSHDCCEWEGVVCNDHTKHVTSLSLSELGLKSSKLRPSLLELQHLTSLNLRGNQFTMRIPKFISSLGNLTTLSLSNAGFFGEIPPHLGNLSNLRSLRLGCTLTTCNDFSGQSNGLYAHNLQWLSRLSSIAFLDFTSVNLSNALDWVVTLKMLPDLFVFVCPSCSLPTPTLSSFSHVNSSTYPQVVDLSYNSVSSAFSYLISGTSNPQSLYLGHMKQDQGNLDELLHSLINNNMSISSLEGLNLVGNNLTLQSFKGMMLLSSLTDLDASSNNISGSLSEILQYLPPNLISLDLSSNLLSGVILDAHLSKFSNLLLAHQLSHNNLTFNISEGWTPPFQLQTLKLRSCKVGPSFPSWILTQKSLLALDISNSMISDVVPTAFWDFPNSYGPLDINLSHNNISGMLPNLNLVFPSNDLYSIDLSYNAFHGPIPLTLFRASVLNLSNNKFSKFSFPPHEELSNIPPSCISGSLHNCLFHFDDLVVLNLENNKLSGPLPRVMGSLWKLTALHLSNNKFSGQLPLPMKNCTNLRILELANNRFSGVVPSWLGESMAELVVLTLRANHFSGDLPPNLCHLQSLQILDLSHNELSGTIFGCVHNFSSMANNQGASITFDQEDNLGYTIAGGNVIFLDYASVMWKGTLTDLYSKNLGQRYVINLSRNLLRGEIPIGVTTLKELRSLDLSMNELNGSIPDKIGQLTSLEFLKLSSNRLCGEIPQSLGALTFLGTLNLSNNNLSGRIPTGTQLQGFNASSYGGNPKLCGKPLPTKCPGDEDDDRIQPRSSKDARDDDSFDIQAFLAASGMGFAVGLLGVVGILHFNRPCRLAFFQLVDNTADWIFVATSLFPSKIKRSLCFRKFWQANGAENM